MSAVRYRGFDIVPRHYQLAESGRWTVDVDIRRNGHSRSFSLSEHHATEAEAYSQCVGLGRRIIEGRVKGWSVDELGRGVNPLEWLVRRATADSLITVIIGLAAILGLSGFAILREIRG